VRLINIGIITYNHNHLKTAQVVKNIIKRDKGYSLKLYALPFVSRAQRQVLFNHRPPQENAEHPKELAEKYNLSFKTVSADTEIDNTCDIYIITGAGILSPQCVRNKKILNCHSGIIPMMRGLDSFKWAIYEQKPVGNTLHFIDEQVDKGEIISVIKTEILKEDTIESFAGRHYENEIEMLSNFDKHLKNPQNPFRECETGRAFRRMPIAVEQELSKCFDEYKTRDFIPRVLFEGAQKT